MTLWFCGLARSRDKLKPLYLHYLNAYDQQTGQVGDLPWGALIQIVTWHFNKVIFLDHVTKQKYILLLHLLPPNLAGWWNAMNLHS